MFNRRFIENFPPRYCFLDMNVKTISKDNPVTESNLTKSQPLQTGEKIIDSG